MTLTVEDYRLMHYFHTEKHITRFHNLDSVKRDLATRDPTTAMCLQRFERIEMRLHEASDELEQRLLDRINELEKDLPDVES